jgi:PKD repeat protein
MRPLKVLLSFFFFLTLHHSIFAQLVSVNDGCAPLTVNYTAPGGVASFFWDLGNGVTSNLENPTNSYVNPGTYIVRFRLTPNGPDLATDTVRVY